MSYEKVKGNKHILIGVKQAIRALENGKVKELLVAKDADHKVTNRVIHLCNELNIPVTYVDSKKELGKSANIDVAAAVIAILK